jgi:hypothetical protein
VGHHGNLRKQGSNGNCGDPAEPETVAFFWLAGAVHADAARAEKAAQQAGKLSIRSNNSMFLLLFFARAGGRGDPWQRLCGPGYSDRLALLPR